MENYQEQQVTVSRLKHKKSSTFVQDYADRTNILISDLKGPAGAITLIFGRDAADIMLEEAMDAPDGTKAMVPKEVEAYRLELAAISLPEYAARGLAQAILAALDRKPTSVSEA